MPRRPDWAILARAADRIDRHGWAKGEERSDDGGYCALGAIDAEAHDAGLRSYEVDNLVEETVASLPVTPPDHWNPRDALCWWNDCRGRTAEGVTRTLRAQAVRKLAEQWRP